MKRFLLWYHWRCLDVAAYLMWWGPDVETAKALDCMSYKAKNKLDDYDLHQRFVA